MGKKQPKNDETENNHEAVKKIKLFSAKEFRKEITTENALSALKHFQEAIKDSDSHDYVLEYLENGGNCLELLQSLESNSAIPPGIVFDLITYILLKINTVYPKYQGSAYESCRYILNNYVTVINKMINLSSTTPERKSCLKLLTAMVAFSPTLAKDILIHVNFHSTNVELLTKHTGEKDSVRDNFIKFLTAYLVDGHYPALSVLLEKKGFFTSIITGLKFDSADTLCLVISAMKNFILENPFVSKTAKMKTFNTIVIRDIVNLYNWKGPAGFRAEKKNKSAAVTVDEIDKSKVNEAVHDFLLILCTNHKFGIIFKDHSVGLGKKNQNALMYTVLESLDRPWEHSYASELVTKICGACPDLAKTLWGNLKSFLEPRLSQKWINAMKFAVNLIKQLQPNCIDFCSKQLNELQLFQVLQCLVLPLPIIKIVFPENNNFDRPSVKQYVLSLLLEMLKSVQQFLDYSKSFFSPERYSKFELLISKFVSKNFPDSIRVLTDWETPDENSPLTSSQNLGNVVDILNFYKIISPDLLENLNNDDKELSKLLFSENFDELQVKIINLFIDLNQSKFNTDSEMFSKVVPLLFRIYYNNPVESCLNVLNKLFKHTGIFDGCLYEINIWISAILDLKSFDESLANDIVGVLKITNDNIPQFLEELSSIQSKSGREQYYTDVIENLNHLTGEIQKFPVKHRYLSPMIKGLIKFLNESDASKALKLYINFVAINLLHLQTKIDPVLNLIEKIPVLSPNFKEYANSWAACTEISCLNKSKGRLTVFHALSKEFLSGDVEEFTKNTDFSLYPDLKLNLLDMIIFYVTNLLNTNNLTEEIVTRAEIFVKWILKNDITNSTIIERLLCHPVLVHSTLFLEINKNKPQSHSTKFLMNVKHLLESNCNIDKYLNIYREKLLNSVIKILNKPRKYDQISVDVKTLLQMYGLGYKECSKILEILSMQSEKYTKHDLIVGIFEYSLKQFTLSCIYEPLQGDIAFGLSKYLVLLAENQNVIVHTLSSIFLEYLRLFPHHINDIDDRLFEALLELQDFDKDTIKLTAFLLEKNSTSYKKIVEEKLEAICEKKIVLLPLLEALCKKQIDEDLLKKIYDLTVVSLNKTIQKPQKVGQHYHENYSGLIVMINVAMPAEVCKKLFEKLQKFDTTEIFHVKLLKTVCLKALNNSPSSKEINNMIMTFVHMQINLFKKNLKADAEISKVADTAAQFMDILTEVEAKKSEIEFGNTARNESLKLYFKFCLKYGMSNRPILLKTLRLLLEIINVSFGKEDSKLVLEMLTSHSEFLEIVLGEYSETKTEILSLYLVLCKTWPEFMERPYVPLLLASYRAQVNKCDRIILLLLKMFESKPEQTNFYDFKPFLWGKAAATHYSVRLQTENALWRQPKMSDVLDILQEDLVMSTITNYPVKDNLRPEERELLDVDDKKCYDLVFLLPLFSQLLAPEQQVLTYKFTRSGALSLTVTGLSSSDKEIRQAACHVLARFHYHVDARQTGKDNLLWIRYVEAVCKGTALLPDFKLNNFAAIYLARMALILTQPNHVMYLPLSQHLTAKSSLNFATVPELYTFLHSSDVNFKEHRNFILELLRDGLRTDKDFSDFMRSMAFKLFSELYSSTVSDIDTKFLVLDVVRSMCGVGAGVKVLCESTSFLAQVYTEVTDVIHKEKSHLVVNKLLEILLMIVKVAQDRHTHFMVLGIAKKLIRDNFFRDTDRLLFEILFFMQNKFEDLFTRGFFDNLLSKVDDSVCTYWNKYGCDFVSTEDLNSVDKCYYLRMFVIKFIKSNV